MKRILIVGSGFGGMWAALSAARVLDLKQVGAAEVEVMVLAPTPELQVRPRLYEDNPGAMSVPLGPLFREVGVRFVRGTADGIDVANRVVRFVGGDGARGERHYDKLVLASGSRLHRPNIPGLAEHAFSVDQIDEARELDVHLAALARRARSAARDTVVVAGGGFTGIELACELPRRVKALLASESDPRIVIVEQATEIGPELGGGPRPVILQALQSLGIELVLGQAVAAVSADGVLLANGESIPAQTVVWTAGMRASTLASQIPGELDHLGRLLVDRDLRVPQAPDVFATGDAASAQTDDAGNRTVMSCQHALLMGRSAGNNAACDLLGTQTIPYQQPEYGTTLDLGAWGAVRCEGWDRQVVRSGIQVKPLKATINAKLIYPPPPNRALALEAANPRLDINALKRQVEAMAAT